MRHEIRDLFHHDNVFKALGVLGEVWSIVDAAKNYIVYASREDNCVFVRCSLKALHGAVDVSEAGKGVVRRPVGRWFAGR